MSSPAASSQNLSSPRTSSVASSNVFVINALEKISNSKEARRSKSLKETVSTALSKIQKKNTFQRSFSSSLLLFFSYTVFI